MRGATFFLATLAVGCAEPKSCDSDQAEFVLEGPQSFVDASVVLRAGHPHYGEANAIVDGEFDLSAEVAAPIAVAIVGPAAFHDEGQFSGQLSVESGDEHERFQLTLQRLDRAEVAIMGILSVRAEAPHGCELTLELAEHE